ncbi:hypothetical protein [Flavobacterium terrigena]|uniref:Uncharacterized protein n=1 Tax=Flavobacterium terrigena TaxID=402734 RepID=A0A1H6QT02_9FLAO|nr:hypothetical protein [Flavobacterium terrigena]SEI42395.1 hypothetical protein SAMN05660918_0487 [Flavobacterium terrigena]
MKTKNQTDILNELIVSTRNRRNYELESLKEEFHGVCESLKPFNLIKELFHDATNSPELKHNLTNGAVGLGTGFLLKKLLTGNSKTFGKKILGNVIQFGVANLVSKHVDEIKTIGKHLFNRISESILVKKDTRKNGLTI